MVRNVCDTDIMCLGFIIRAYRALDIFRYLMILVFPRMFGSDSIVFVVDDVIYFRSAVSHAHHLCIVLEIVSMGTSICEDQ